MLTLDDIQVSYGRCGRKGITLEIREVSWSLAGANGAGKTTTLMTISGILRPRSSHITLRHDLTKSSLMISSHGRNPVLEGRHVFGNLSVRENLLWGHSARDRQEVGTWIGFLRSSRCWASVGGSRAPR
jgi:branched-chain amino acid transport system ATP-binding protein